MIRINSEKLRDDADYRELVEYIRTAELFADLPVLPGDDDQQRSWLQIKVAAQKKALRRLNDRVFNQRIQLRLLNELGRGLTKEEWEQAKSKYVRLEDDLLVS